MSVFSPNLRISVVFFLLFFLISHLLLPFFGRSDWLFFSEWRLFALEPKLYVYDISLIKIGEKLNDQQEISSENFYFRFKSNQLLENVGDDHKNRFHFMNSLPEAEREEFEYALFRSDLNRMSLFFNEQFFAFCKCTDVIVSRIDASAASWINLSKPISDFKISKMTSFKKNVEKDRK